MFRRFAVSCSGWKVDGMSFYSGGGEAISREWGAAPPPLHLHIARRSVEVEAPSRIERRDVTGAAAPLRHNSFTIYIKIEFTVCSVLYRKQVAIIYAVS